MASSRVYGNTPLEQLKSAAEIMADLHTELDHEIEERDNRIAELERDLKDRDDEISDLKDTIRELEKEEA